MTARAASEAGFAPAVEYAEPGVMVSAFLGAKTYDGDDVRDNRIRIARLMRGFHTEMPKHVSGAGFMFWVFHVIRDYARYARGGQQPDDPSPAVLSRARRRAGEGAGAAAGRVRPQRPVAGQFPR